MLEFFCFFYFFTWTIEKCLLLCGWVIAGCIWVITLPFTLLSPKQLLFLFGGLMLLGLIASFPVVFLILGAICVPFFLSSSNAKREKKLLLGSKQQENGNRHSGKATSHSETEESMTQYEHWLGWRKDPEPAEQSFNEADVQETYASEANVQESTSEEIDCAKEIEIGTEDGEANDMRAWRESVDKLSMEEKQEMLDEMEARLADIEAKLATKKRFHGPQGG